MRRFRAVLLGLALSIPAALGVGCGDEAPPVQESATSTSAGEPSAELPEEGSPDLIATGGPIRFVLEDSYQQGEMIEVKIENAGEETYLYQGSYAACFMKFSDSNGREFIIPPGTHCDLLVELPIEPGEVRRLFVWELDECIKDRWGCVESEVLAPGIYSMHGRFKPEGEGEPVKAAASFEVEPAHPELAEPVRFDSAAEALAFVDELAIIPVALPGDLPPDATFTVTGAPEHVQLTILSPAQPNLVVQYGDAGFDGCEFPNLQREFVKETSAMISSDEVADEASVHSTIVWPATKHALHGRYAISGLFSPEEVLGFARSMEGLKATRAYPEEQRGC